MSKLISVIVPVYNVEKYLRRCINSVINQTYKNIELILVDDGSPDNCGSICDEYAGKDSRVRVIHKENGGVSVARNVGIREAVGEYIMFVDSDDRLCDNAFEALVGDYDFSVGSCRVVSKKNSFNYTLGDACLNTDDFIKIYMQETRKGNILFSTPWAKLYRTSIIKENKMAFDKNLKLTEDTKFNYEYFKHVKTAHFSSAVVYDYNQENESSASKKYFADNFIYKKTTHQTLTEWLSDKKYEQFILYDLGELVYYSIYHSIMHCSGTNAAKNIELMYNQYPEDFNVTREHLDARLGGGYLKLLENRNWQGLILRWKRKNLKSIIKNKIKVVLVKWKIIY